MPKERFRVTTGNKTEAIGISVMMMIHEGRIETLITYCMYLLLVWKQILGYRRVELSSIFIDLQASITSF